MVTGEAAAASGWWALVPNRLTYPGFLSLIMGQSPAPNSGTEKTSLAEGQEGITESGWGRQAPEAKPGTGEPSLGPLL